MEVSSISALHSPLSFHQFIHLHTHLYSVSVSFVSSNVQSIHWSFHAQHCQCTGISDSIHLLSFQSLSNHGWHSHSQAHVGSCISSEIHLKVQTVFAVGDLSLDTSIQFHEGMVQVQTGSGISVHPSHSLKYQTSQLHLQAILGIIQLYESQAYHHSVSETGSIVDIRTQSHWAELQVHIGSIIIWVIQFSFSHPFSQ